MSEQGEDGGTLYNSSLAILNSFFTKASICVVPEIGGQGLVLRILKAMNSTNSSLALPSCTWKEVAHVAIMVLNRDTIGLEETVYWQAPALFQSLCNAWP